MEPDFADVIVNITASRLDRPFQYRIPAALKGKVRPGVPLLVPFGKGERRLKGYCIGLKSEPEIEPERIREILQVAEKDNTLEDKLVRLAVWMHRYYGGTLLQALRTVLPVKRRVKRRIRKRICPLVSVQQLQKALEETEKRGQRAKARVIRELISEGELPYELVRDRLHVSPSSLTSLEKQGLIRIEERAGREDAQMICAGEASFALSDAQRGIVETILQEYREKARPEEKEPKVYLLHGVTGSGKTAVYVEAAKRMAALGKQVIVLIPEISLTYQTVMRFYREFGERVSVIHSGLSDGERSAQYERAMNGELDVIIGPRSALFTPFSALGLIIIDEEHEASYKSEQVPRYHAREAAKMLAGLHHAALLLGSATPSVDSCFKAMEGEYRYFRLTERAGGASLPSVHIEDMRKELKKGNRSVFSEKLKALLAQRLAGKEQSMLFLNRRGYAGFCSCRECGHVAKCPHCDVSLTLHQNGMLVCHYCGHQEPKREQCPECGSRYFMGFRAGTEQIEEGIKKLFPGARVLRMDRDTTKRKDDYEKLLSAFMNEEADILIGTQMIVKGHDFPRVTLVGILAADISLAASDYRAAERTFSLLTQAAGRAGRGGLAGEVVIQTYRPEDPVIGLAAAQDYEGFYAREIAYRRLLSYPPICRLLCVQITSGQQKRAAQLAAHLASRIRNDFRHTPIMGPSPGRIGKLNDIYRYAFYVKPADDGEFLAVKESLEGCFSVYPVRDETMSFDPDPMQGF